MTDSLLMNDGSSFFLLNSGGTILLNEHVDEVKIHGIQASQRLIQRGRTEQLIPVIFTFQLLARTIPRIIIQLISIGKVLKPKGNYSESLRDSFRLEVTDLKIKLDKLSKHVYIESVLEFFVDGYFENYLIGKKLFKSIKGGVKRWKLNKK